jgi:hypothetical protein
LQETNLAIGSIMASGMGVRGTMGRCYGFFADYKQCQVRRAMRLKAVVVSHHLVLTHCLCLVVATKTDTAAALRKYENDPAAVDPEKPVGGCIAMREDYFECLHGRKENLRIKTVMAELKKQEHESKHGVAAGAH